MASIAVTGRPTTRRYHISMHRTQVFQQVCFLLEHGHAQPTRKRLFPSVNTQVGLEVPAHAKLFATVLAPVFSRRCCLASSCPTRLHVFPC